MRPSTRSHTTVRTAARTGSRSRPRRRNCCSMPTSRGAVRESRVPEKSGTGADCLYPRSPQCQSASRQTSVTKSGADATQTAHRTQDHHSLSGGGKSAKPEPKCPPELKSCTTLIERKPLRGMAFRRGVLPLPGRCWSRRLFSLAEMIVQRHKMTSS